MKGVNHIGAAQPVDLFYWNGTCEEIVSWTEVGRDASRWALRQSLSPQSRAGGGLVYGLAAIKLEEDLAEGFLEFEGSSARIFVNRVLIGHIHRAELEHPRRVRFPVSLVKGWNRVVVKMTGGSGVFVCGQDITEAFQNKHGDSSSLETRVEANKDKIIYKGELRNEATAKVTGQLQTQAPTASSPAAMDMLNDQPIFSPE